MADVLFPPLPDDWEPTRATLHAYAQAMGVISRAWAEPHPKWWHVSLKVTPIGLITDPKALAGGGTFHLRMDLRAHDVVVETSTGISRRLPMTEGRTGSEFGEAVVAAVAALGLEGDYAREKITDDDVGEYRPEHAERFFDTLVNVNQVLLRRRQALSGSVGPVQLWPHGFDLAFEWFGTRVERYEENGEVVEYPSQLNLGFYLKDAYFYSNPWPFDVDALSGIELPHGARWHTEGWEGSILPYERLAGDPEGGRKLLEYADAVFAAAAPTLMAS